MKKLFILYMGLIGLMMTAGTLFAADLAEMPQWVQKMNLKGDFRLRCQWQEKEGSAARSRERMRFRIQGEEKVNDEIIMGFRLASGSADPRSTNQTLENSFETKPIMLDYAYAEYEARSVMTLTGGKFDNNKGFWKPVDFLWDSDIMVEGLAIAFNQNKKAEAVVKGVRSNAFLNTGIYVVDERSADRDPMLYVVQVGLDIVTSDKIKIKCSATTYAFDGLKGSVPAWSSGTNSGLTKSGDTVCGSLTQGYKDETTEFEVLLKNIFPATASIFFESVNNLNLTVDNAGYIIGVKLGNQKVINKGEWRIGYDYRRLQKDAWPDFLPDFDAYSGSTGIWGHRIQFEYGLKNNSSFAVNYLHMSDITTDAKPEDLVQLDMLFKF